MSKLAIAEFLQLIKKEAADYSEKNKILIDIRAPEAVRGKYLVIENIEISEPISLGVIQQAIVSFNKNWEGILFVKCKFSLFSAEGALPKSSSVISGSRLGFHDCFIDCFSLSNSKIDELAMLSTSIRRLEIGNVKRTQISFIGFNKTTIGQVVSHSWNDPSNPRHIEGDLSFYNIKFLDAFALKYLTFKGNLSFKGCSFRQSPDFIGSTLTSETEFTNCSFSEYSSRSITHYRFLKKIFREYANDHMADLFGYLEMRSWAENSRLDWIEKIVAASYFSFSKYGQSLSKAIWSYFFLLALYFYAYLWCEIYLSKVLIFESTSSTPLWLKQFASGVQSHEADFIFLQTIKLWLGPLGLAINLNGLSFTNWFYAGVAWSLQLISSVMLFVIILMIRRRFKLN